jgi:hypothetical protein
MAHISFSEREKTAYKIRFFVKCTSFVVKP